ncbi:uncharacterized protein BT62DRAFT_1076143 [Guyanagaster necrorhizus]|uniref:BCAS3 WD40 domain-containing protein n=1 Tax=Guyanagaster necrorhizus TaxID=856835 RepID=A0A9P8ASW8_9AGAR|nr:uncharacterized protein BT62DRAFT_1076143 [Guyanagaster necrorhizus MCA 3950]KAG7446600.1 hypothetical protein BT62DRAFT_1076143 [Guyanagaster necrorhizus MCA 3950]
MPLKNNRHARRNNISHQSNDQDTVDTVDDARYDIPNTGHTRSPVFSRELTMLESFSRTVRNYVPSSIPIPAAVPSPPLVSRPVITSTSQVSSISDEPLASGLAQAMQKNTTGADTILWSRWDSLGSRRLLFLGYSSGFQIWDCTRLNSVDEVLNLNDFDDVVTYAAVLPGQFAIGVLTKDSDFLVYSLSSHQIVKRIPLATSAYSFSASHEYIVIAITNPPALQVLTSSTFSTVDTIPSSSLVSFTHTTSAPHPIYTLSRRLLAYASLPPSPTTAINNAPATPPKPIATTAKSVINGMKSFGGLAYSAALNKLGGDAKPVSRNVPGALGGGEADTLHQDDQLCTETGYYVTVLDLQTGAPLARFPAFKHSSISCLSFSPDGCSLLSVSKDGQVSRVHQLRLTPSGVCSASNLSAPHHVYDLRRGRTSAIVENVEWSTDGRWIAIGTRKRTIHVFAVNPYGGAPDVESHMCGRVRNAESLQPLSIELAPIIRIRLTSNGHVSGTSSANGPSSPPIPPPVFQFPAFPNQTLPPSLLPISSPQLALLSIPSSSPSDSGSPRHAQGYPQQPIKNFQDLLVFDAADGLLQLKRWLLGSGGVRDIMDLGSIGGMTSVSLPLSLAIGGNRVSPRQRGRRLSSGAGGGISPDMTISKPEGKSESELVANKDTVVATWDLKRRKDWAEVKKIFEDEEATTRVQSDFLSQAELSTNSKSRHILPRSIYLSHQFTFHTLGEDYHALIRRYQLDIPGVNIEVRKQVQVSAYSTLNMGGEAFIEASSSISRRSLFFDEPLASALLQSDGFSDRLRGVGTVLPMLPNGDGHGSSRMTSIPIRGVSESFGRLRREMIVARRRSGKRRSRKSGEDEGLSMSVPLEFDEAEEDFVFRVLSDDGALDDSSASRGDEDSNALSLSTAATSEYPVDADQEDIENGGGGVPISDDAWNDGWGVEDKNAVEEVEMYDHISAVGLLDEEQEEIDRRIREEKEKVASVAKGRGAKTERRSKRKG